jgi:protocatechuate 3,4-dioxygenase, beta subunit
MASNISLPRRQRLRCSSATSMAFFANPGVFAEELMRTPNLTEGPFYPDKLPLDQDNDLIVIRDGSSQKWLKTNFQNTNSMGTRR